MYGQYKTNFNKVQEFQRQAGQPVSIGFTSQDELQFRYDLIHDELQELKGEIDYLPFGLVKGEKDKVKANILKEAADVLYTVYGLLATIGVDADDVFNEVHQSNMSKMTNGKLLKREDCKVLKGPDYRPANTNQFIKRFSL